jgi:hypothetical protein
MQFFTNLFRKRRSLENEKLDQILRLTLELRSINDKRNMDSDIRLKRVLDIANKATIAISDKNSNKALAHNHS